jgi:aryl-alcohol dehydrogenase-like predicted oxidoreductase
MRLEPHEDHDIGPKRPGSIANSIRYLAAWRRLGRFDEDAAVAAIGRARELGVDVFDTAQA